MTNKIIFWLLLSYVLFQLASLFLGNAPLFFAYIIVYLIAIVYTATKCAKMSFTTGSIKPLTVPIVMFLLANLLLFLIYLPTLIFNPNINWRLKGEAEADPMLLQAYVPVVFFVIAFLVILLGSVSAKLVAHKRNRIKIHF
jgi:hypothetical protein